LPKLPVQQYKAIVDAAAVAAYHAENGVKVIQILICNDAPNSTARKLNLGWSYSFA
jgi:hypothetical protein